MAILSFSLRRKSVDLWRNEYAPKQTQRHNQRGWLRAKLYLGDRHLLARPVQRITRNF